MSSSQMLDRVVACYPPWWRAVYGSEVHQLNEDLLADGLSPWHLAVNLLWGALRARLFARGMPMRPDLWAARSRSSIAVATLPWLAVLPFVVYGLKGSTVDYVFHGPNALRRADGIANRTGAHVIGHLYQVLGWADVIGLIAVIVGWSALSQATVGSSLHRLTNVPLLFLAVLVALYVARTTQLNRAWMSHGLGPPIPLGSNGPAAGPLLVALWVVFVVGVLVTSAALATVARRVEIPIRALRTGRRVATVIALVLCCSSVCAIGGALLASRYGVVQSPVGSSWVTHHVVAASVTVLDVHWSFLAIPLAVAAVLSTAGCLASRGAAWALSTFQLRL